MAAPVTSLTDLFDALATPAGRRDPYPLYEAIRAHGPVAALKPGRLLVVGHDACDRALRESALHVQDARGFDATVPGWRSHSSLRAFTGSMLYSNPPDHARLRAVAGFAFTPPRIRDLRSVIEDMADRLLEAMADKAAAGAPLDLIGDFASRLPIAVISTMLGFPARDQEWFRETASAVAASTDGFTDPAALERADAAMDELTSYFTDLTDHRRRTGTGTGDLVGHLTAVHDARPPGLSHDELMGTLMILLTAGFETTSFLIGHGVLLALAHPHHAARLRTDPDFAVPYTEEVLRYEPPVHVTSRYAVADTEVAGTPVAAGSRLTLILAAANRDPAHHLDPHRFDPHRAMGRHLGFGAGPHFCLGAPLARLETRIALPRLLRRFPRLAATTAPVYRDRWVVRGLETFPVTLHP